MVAEGLNRFSVTVLNCDLDAVSVGDGRSMDDGRRVGCPVPAHNKCPPTAATMMSENRAARIKFISNNIIIHALYDQADWVAGTIHSALDRAVARFPWLPQTVLRAGVGGTAATFSDYKTERLFKKTLGRDWLGDALFADLRVGGRYSRTPIYCKISSKLIINFQENK